MEFNPIYFEDKVYKDLIVERKRSANAILADYLPCPTGVDFDTQVAPEFKLVHALESSYNTYNSVRKSMAKCPTYVYSMWTATTLQQVLEKSSSVLQKALAEEYVKADKEVSRCLRSMLKDMLRWTAAMFDTLADNVHVVEDHSVCATEDTSTTWTSAKDLFDD